LFPLHSNTFSPTLLCPVWVAVLHSYRHRGI